MNYLPSNKNVLYVVDNNEEKWGSNFFGYKIVSPSTLANEEKSRILIIVASMYYAEISKQLMAMGFDEHKHFINSEKITGNKRLLLNKLHKVICGSHPYNHIFSFNYLTTKNIVADIKDNASLFTGTLVDVGAGNSPYYELFNVGEYIAIDLPGALPTNEKRKIIQYNGDALNLPLPDDSCDCAVSMQVLEHISDPDKALKEINRVLKGNGLVLISVPHVTPIHLEPYDFFRYTPNGMMKLLESNGFEVIKVKQQGGLFTSLALLFNMDIIISKYNESNYHFEPKILRMILLAPLIALINLLSLILDRIYKSNRSPTNLFVIGRKTNN